MDKMYRGYHILYMAVNLSSCTTHAETLSAGPIRTKIIFISMPIVKFKSLSSGR